MGPLDDEMVARLRIEASQGGDDFFPQYIEYFCQDLEQAAKDLIAAAKEENAHRFLQIGHRLRGAAGNFGAHQLIELCLRLENLAKEDRISEVLVILPFLQAELPRVEQAARALQI